MNWTAFDTKLYTFRTILFINASSFLSMQIHLDLSFYIDIYSLRFYWIAYKYFFGKWAKRLLLLFDWTSTAKDCLQIDTTIERKTFIQTKYQTKYSTVDFMQLYEQFGWIWSEYCVWCVYGLALTPIWLHFAIWNVRHYMLCERACVFVSLCVCLCVSARNTHKWWASLEYAASSTSFNVMCVLSLCMWICQRCLLLMWLRWMYKINCDACMS